MIPVTIDISDIAQEFYLTQDEMNAFSKFVVEVVASKFAKQWEEQAKNNLHQTRNEYIRSIYVQSISDTAKVVGLKGFIPNAVESGIGAFDQKPWFEKSKKVKLKKDGGWYLTIPFRFGIPGTIGESTVFSGNLPDEIHTVLQKISKQRDISKIGLKFNEIPEQYRAPSTRGRVEAVIDSSKDLKSKVFEEYTHKSPLHEGMIKSDVQYHSQYNTFRRVSDLSDPNSWIHTGIHARNLAESALNELNIESVVDRAVDKFLTTL